MVVSFWLFSFHRFDFTIDGYTSVFAQILHKRIKEYGLAHILRLCDYMYDSGSESFCLRFDVYGIKQHGGSSARDNLATVSMVAMAVTLKNKN